MKRRGIIATISCLALLILSVVIFSSSKEAKQEQPLSTSRATTVAETKQTEPETTTKKEVNHDNDTHSILTGKWISKDIAKNRLVAVMFNNVPEACPQAGISKADIIYEVPIEGFVPRLMGIMQDYKELSQIGSVRSCRLCFAQLAMEYDAIYLHYGQSEYALSTLNSSAIDNLSGLESVGNSVYYRRNDRYAPHNAYASADGIAQGAKIKGYSTKIAKDYTKHFKFASDETEIVLKKGDNASYVAPGFSVNSPYFEYNKKKDNYTRYQYGSKQIDENNGHVLTCRNIILQNVNYSYFGNGYSQNYYMVGSGSGKFITGGKAIDITWQKDSESSITRYYKSNGKEITLNQGKTWICIIPSDLTSHVDIS